MLRFVFDKLVYDWDHYVHYLNGTNLHISINRAGVLLEQLPRFAFDSIKSVRSIRS